MKDASGKFGAAFNLHYEFSGKDRGRNHKIENVITWLVDRKVEADKRKEREEAMQPKDQGPHRRPHELHEKYDCFTEKMVKIRHLCPALM